MKEEYFSVRFEPAGGAGKFKPDPSEKKAAKIDAKQDDIAAIRDSVFNEPAITLQKEQYHLKDWIEKKRAECTIAGNLSVALLAAILGGPFAVLGAFMAGRQGWSGLLYMVVFAPVIEEIMKQSGMIYLLERRPYRIFTSWQFVFSALVSALVFATIENLLYIHVYAPQVTLVDHEFYASFRWTVCTALHVCCSAIASIGMIRVWKKQLADGKPADLSVAFRYFLIAIVIHGGYNLAAIFFNRFFLK